eukprot:16695_1
MQLVKEGSETKQNDIAEICNVKEPLFVPFDSDIIIWGFIHHFLQQSIPSDIVKIIQKYAIWGLEWDQRLDKRGANASFPSHDTVICGHLDPTFNGHCTVILRNVLSSDIFEQIIFKFIVKSFTVHSYFGFIDYPDFFIKDTQTYWDTLFRYSKHSYAVVTYQSLRRKIYYYHHKSRKEFDMEFDIEDGAHFVFVMDFVKKQCNVFINQIDEKYRIYPAKDKPTWENMSDCLIPAYSHHSAFETQSKVKVELMSYKLRK